MVMAPRRVRVQAFNGNYLVAVRYLGWNYLQDFVQPDNPDVMAVYSRFGPDPWSLYDWVCRNINYRRDIGEMWQFPSETLARGQGDCEDSSILLCSLNGRGYVILGTYQNYGHAWYELGGQLFETTYTQARHVPDPQDYCPYVIFNDQQVVELWPGALDEVFRPNRDEATKLNLLATALQDGNPGYRYAELPSMCICHECGYTVANPRVHCPQLGECPVCHAPRLWRA